MKYTCEDNPAEFDDLPEERKQILLTWIREQLIPIKSFNRKHTSYGLKHKIQTPIFGDEYFTNGEFKGAMLQAGYEPLDPNAQNWVFTISEKSPGLNAPYR